jgi:hypothetical protein
VLGAYKAELDRLTELMQLPKGERDVMARLRAKEDECEVLRSEVAGLQEARKEREGARVREVLEQVAAKDQQSPFRLAGGPRAC